MLARVVQVFGAAQAHHGYLFANMRATRIKLLVHDGFGVWCTARRLNQGSYVWPREVFNVISPLALSQQQFDALVLGHLAASGSNAGDYAHVLVTLLSTKPS